MPTAPLPDPLLDPSDLPFALPRFADIRADDFIDTIEAAMAEQAAAVEAIAQNPEPPTFANTLVALEQSGLRLDRALAIFFNQASADADERIDAIDAELAPRLAAHADAIHLNGRLATRVEAVAAGGEPLDPESAYLLERTRTAFRRAGAGLRADEQRELERLNGRIAELETAFKIELQADAKELALVIHDPAELDGLTAGELAAARQAADDRGLSDSYLISLVLPTVHPYLSRLTRPRTRARLLEAERARGTRGGEHDTRAILLELVRLRAARARILGYANHADYVLADTSARTAEAVEALLRRVAEPALANAERERALLEARAGGPIGAADWPYWAEQVRRAEHDVDLDALRPHLEADRVLTDGVFAAATDLFGLTFRPREDLEGYHPDVRVYEVAEENGTPVGLYLLDLHARETKRGGAWMTSLIDPAELAGSATAVVVNNLNVPRPAAGEPTLLTFDELTTLFHEFGHALHGLLGKARYPSLVGLSVPPDFVEFPSQVNELWALWPESIRRYALHVETGEPLDPATIERLRAAEAFGQGYRTVEYVAAAWLDLCWHRLTPEDVPTDPAAVSDFETAALAQLGLDHPLIPPRYASSYFAHVFAGGYAAGYYAYLWAEVLDADTSEWFADQGGLVRAAGEAYRRHILAIGGTREPVAAYEEWRGRPAPIEPLLRRRGLL